AAHKNKSVSSYNANGRLLLAHHHAGFTKHIEKCLCEKVPTSFVDSTANIFNLVFLQVIDGDGKAFTICFQQCFQSRYMGFDFGHFRGQIHAATFTQFVQCDSQAHFLRLVGGRKLRYGSHSLVPPPSSLNLSYCHLGPLEHLISFLGSVDEESMVRLSPVAIGCLVAATIREGLCLIYKIEES